jgi:hypothetical protein
MLGGNAGKNLIGGRYAAFAGGGHAFLDALDLPGISRQILLERLIDDVVARPIHRSRQRVDFTDHLLRGTNGNWLCRSFLCHM